MSEEISNPTAEVSVTAAPERLYLLTALVKTEADFAELQKVVAKHPITIKKAENLGARTLAFPIKKAHELLLTSIFFTAQSTAISPIDKELENEETVMRYLLTDWNGDIDPPKRSSKYRDFNKVKEQKGEKAHV